MFVCLYYLKNKQTKKQSTQPELSMIGLKRSSRKQAFMQGKDQNLDLKNNRIHNENS